MSRIENLLLMQVAARRRSGFKADRASARFSVSGEPIWFNPGLLV
jgi:hypothetical protein